jgi:hypothetical protein
MNGRPLPQAEPDGELLVAAGRWDPELVKEHLSTLLSVAAMLAVAVGLGWGLWIYGLGSGRGGGWGPYGLIPAGLLLAFMTAVAASGRDRRPEPIEPPEKPPVPGPTDPGRLHARGPGARP